MVSRSDRMASPRFMMTRPSFRGAATEFLVLDMMVMGKGAIDPVFSPFAGFVIQILLS